MAEKVDGAEMVVESGEAVGDDPFAEHWRKFDERVHDLSAAGKWSTGTRGCCGPLMERARAALLQGDVRQFQLILLQVDVEMERASFSANWYVLSAIIFNLIWLIVVGLTVADLSINGPVATDLGNSQVMGIPIPILIWAGVGTTVAMLVRIGTTPFQDRTEAYRWLGTKPITGLVMGVLAYLMVHAGLLVLVGRDEPDHPEFLWLVAFLGSFSDTLSLNLLKRLAGRLESEEVGRGAANHADEPRVIKILDPAKAVGDPSPGG